MLPMDSVMTGATAPDAIAGLPLEATSAVTVVTRPVPPWQNATQLERPAFLLNFPFSFSTEVANNVWMQDLPFERRLPNFKRAAIQFLELYRCLAGEALIYLLPTPRGVELQDLVFTANL